jgi:methionine-rich copper-binding protein CopC
MARPRSSLINATAALFVVLGALIASPLAAFAHTALDYSVPTEGASVAEPVSEITVAFTEAVTLVGNGFEVFDPQENVLQPVAVTDDDTVFRLQFDPPLAGGPVGVRYEVTSDDGHVVSGSFAFTVSAEALVVTPPPTAPPITQPPVTVPSPTAPPTTETLASGATPDVTIGVQPSEPIATVAAAATTASVPDPTTGGGSNSGVIIAIVIAVIVAAGAFLLARSRTSGGA